jgi:hypothetical protein
MKTLLKALIPGLLMLICTACPSRTEKNEAPDQQHVELLDEFVITAFWGPPLDEVNIERYRQIAHAGIDVLFPGNGIMNGEDNLKALDVAEQAGIRLIPFDTRVLQYAQSADIEIDTSIIDEMVNDYKSHPAFAAYVVRDEPAASMFSRLSDICHLLRERDPRHEPFINLFPSYAGPERLGNVDFRSHVREFIQTVKPGVLSYDHYALREPDTWYELWFDDLDVVRGETRRANIPFWIFIQSEGIRKALRVPTRAEILWQANTALAYGARGLGWFTYWTPKSNPDDPNAEQHYNAMIDVEGNPTRLYDHVREANLYLQPAGKGLIGWDNEFIARYEDGQLMEGGSSPVVTPEGTGVNLIIGTFRRDDMYRVVISNSRCETETSFSLNISPEWKGVELVTSIDASPVIEGKFDGQWTMEAGGSLILEIK